jgi:biotin-(acetyl-CoA carboxylase) ligase
VRWAAGAGTATGIDDSGALLVSTADGQITLESGEIHLLG